RGSGRGPTPDERLSSFSRPIVPNLSRRVVGSAVRQTHEISIRSDVHFPPSFIWGHRAEKWKDPSYPSLDPPGTSQSPSRRSFRIPVLHHHTPVIVHPGSYRLYTSPSVSNPSRTRASKGYRKTLQG
ncbi:Hypothetical predicted protein, partial [Marmota monax]